MRGAPLRVCEELNGRDGAEVAQALRLVKARERNKWSCPACGSRDNLHAFRIGSPRGPGLKCFSCDVSTNTDAAAAALGLPAVEAARAVLAELGGSSTLRADRPPRRPAVDLETEAVNQTANDAARLRLAAAWAAVLRGPLGHDPDVWEWLRGRGLEPDGGGVYGADLHGVSGENWPRVLAGLVDAGATPDDLEAAGLTGPDCRAWNRNPWLVAIYRAPDGTPDGVRLRGVYLPATLDWFKAKGKKVPKWLSLNAHFTTRYPWRAERAAGARVVIVCEGETDAASAELAVQGWPGVIALGAPGTSTWRPEWGELLAGAARVLVFADNDDRGEVLVARVADSTSVTVEAVCLKREFGKDANDLWRDGDLRSTLEDLGVPTW